MYTFLADLTAAVHLALLAFVVIGELLIVVGGLCRWQWVRNFWFRLVHLVIIGVIVYEAVNNIQCPLTVWEDELRVLGGAEPNDKTFIERLIHPVLFKPDLSFDDPRLQASYYYFGALVLITLILVPPRLPRRSPPVDAETPTVPGSDSV